MSFFLFFVYFLYFFLYFLMFLFILVLFFFLIFVFLFFPFPPFFYSFFLPADIFRSAQKCVCVWGAGLLLLNLIFNLFFCMLLKCFQCNIIKLHLFKNINLWQRFFTSSAITLASLILNRNNNPQTFYFSLSRSNLELKRFQATWNTYHQETREDFIFLKISTPWINNTTL